MNSILLSYEDLQIPHALALHHGSLREQLLRAAAAPRRVGEAAEHLARLCFSHFDQEEENIFRAFGLMHEFAAEDRLHDGGAIARMIESFDVQDDALRAQHLAIKAAVEELLHEAGKEENGEIIGLIESLRQHERTEDQVMYPAVMQIAQALQQGMELLAGSRRSWLF